MGQDAAPVAEELEQERVLGGGEVDRLTGLDRSRITRIMNLRLQEPWEQEALLGASNYKCGGSGGGAKGVYQLR